MPGFEVIGREEREAINHLFDLNGGILFAHGFEGLRKGIYRVREFERAFAEYCNVRFAQAVSSGSAALKVGLKALGVQPGDEVITQSFTFIATVEAILEVGAIPVIVDVDKTMNMDPDMFEQAITEKTKVCIPVHMLGFPARMDRIMAIAKKYGLKVLEDTAQATGAEFQGRFLGTFGDIGSFSFDGGKTLTTGEGGMVVTDNEDLYIRARAYHDHGHEYNTSLSRGKEKALGQGFNYRMMELQGALGLVQLKKLDTILSAQRSNKARLMKGLEQLPFEFNTITDAGGESGDTIVFFANSGEQASVFAKGLSKAGIGTKNLPDAIRWHFAGYWDHLFREHLEYKGKATQLWQSSSKLLKRSIALPVMVNMTQRRINYIVENILRIAEELKMDSP